MAQPILVERVCGALQARTEILEAYLFGSTARGEGTAHSDVDVAVYVDPEHLRSVDAPFGYDAALASLLMRALRRNDIDVVLLNVAPPAPLPPRAPRRYSPLRARSRGDDRSRRPSPIAFLRLRSAACQDRPRGAR